MEIHELPPHEFVRYQSAKGQEEVLRAQARALLKQACIQEQIAEDVLRGVDRGIA